MQENHTLIRITDLGRTRKVEIKFHKIQCDLALRTDFNRHGFVDYPDPSCPCGFRDQTKIHYFLDCPLTAQAREQFNRGILDLEHELFNFTHFYRRNRKLKVDFMVYGDNTLPPGLNKTILNLTADFLDNILE